MSGRKLAFRSGVVGGESEENAREDLVVVVFGLVRDT